jgi:acyl-CoA dehydrogenase
MESDRAFSRKVGARGWLGMTWPKRYGGHERTAFERYVVLEEMLVAGAPVGAHWIGDRQTGPLILRYGTEAQRERSPGRPRRDRLLHRYERADTASTWRSARAERTGDGWRVNG